MTLEVVTGPYLKQDLGVTMFFMAVERGHLLEVNLKLMRENVGMNKELAVPLTAYRQERP